MKKVHAELIHHYGTVTLKVYLPDDILYFAEDSFREAKRKCKEYISPLGFKLPNKDIQHYLFPV